MQISSVGLNNFKGSDGIIEAEFRDVTPRAVSKGDKYEFTEENADRLRQVAIDLDENSDKVTTPFKYFMVSAITAGLAFMAGKKITSRLLEYGLDGSTKPIPKFVNGLRDKVSGKLAGLVEGFKGKKIIGSLSEKFAKYGENAFEGLNAEHLRNVFTGANATVKQNMIGAINKILALGAGAGAAGFHLAKRYEDKDGNSIPDKMERGMSVVKEVAEAGRAVADAMGIV